MSVTVTKQAYIVPIFREPTDPGKHSLLARWHFAEVAAGDLSGGDWFFSALLSNLGQIYGPYSMFDIRLASYSVAAVLAGLYGRIDALSYERTSGTPGVHLIQTIPNDTIRTYNMQRLSDYKFRTSDIAGTQSQINLSVGPNTNAYNCTVCLAGYIYDERYL